MTPEVQRLLTPENLVTDKAFDKYIEMVRGGQVTTGKIVTAKVGEQVIVAIGSTNLYHVQLVSEAAQEILRREVCTSRHPDHARPLEGIIIEGARFRYDKDRANIKIYDTSMSFGGFRTKIFSETTEVVLARFLLQRIDPTPDAEMGDFSAELRKKALSEGPPPTN